MSELNDVQKNWYTFQNILKEIHSFVKTVYKCLREENNAVKKNIKILSIFKFASVAYLARISKHAYLEISTKITLLRQRGGGVVCISSKWNLQCWKYTAGGKSSSQMNNSYGLSKNRFRSQT